MKPNKSLYIIPVILIILLVAAFILMSRSGDNLALMGLATSTPSPSPTLYPQSTISPGSGGSMPTGTVQPTYGVTSASPTNTPTPEVSVTMTGIPSPKPLGY